MTPVLDLPSHLAQELFDIYVQPIYDYCSAIWTTNVCKSAKDNMNRVYMKFIKRYIMVPKSSPTDIFSYLVTGTKPLSTKIFENPTKPLGSINLSIKLPGHQLYLVKNKPPQEDEYRFEMEVPQKFWDILANQKCLPTNVKLRKRFTSRLFDLNHRKLCTRTKDDFHNQANPLKCICSDCK